jgi:quercetin dioxygenase-like cupin family protein
MTRMLQGLIPFLLLCTSVTAQHVHETRPMAFANVLVQPFADEGLANYRLESSVATLAPGMVDTVSHRHDCELFGYVLKGSVSVGFEKNVPLTFSKGQMFYERKNILHSLLANNSKTETAEILLLFVIREGARGYIPEYKKN